jgi:hypothetical protein
VGRAVATGSNPFSAEPDALSEEPDGGAAENGRTPGCGAPVLTCLQRYARLHLHTVRLLASAGAPGVRLSIACSQVAGARELRRRSAPAGSSALPPARSRRGRRRCLTTTECLSPRGQRARRTRAPRRHGGVARGGPRRRAAARAGTGASLAPARRRSPRRRSTTRMRCSRCAPGASLSQRACALTSRMRDSMDAVQQLHRLALLQTAALARLAPRQDPCQCLGLESAWLLSSAS